MSDTNVRLQDLRDFTVQIRTANDVIVGTGVAVSSDGKIVTCAHVAEAALGVRSLAQAPPDAEVTVYFPQAQPGETKSRRAVIAGRFNEHHDDAVLLQLTGALPPLGPEQIAKVGDAAGSDCHPFRSYGYRALEYYPAAWAGGEIMGCVECPPHLNLQAEPVQLRSPEIAPGMSGAPVLDMERNLVVGIISETYNPPEGFKDRDTAWAVDTRVFTFEPLKLLLQQESQPKTAAPIPPELPDPRLALLRPATPAAWHGAPALLDEWVGREELFRDLTGDWESDAVRITALVGFGGEGKSSLARQWVDKVASRKPQASSDKPQATSNEQPVTSIFWWSFYDNASVDAFAEALLIYLSGEQIDPRTVPSTAAKLELCARLMQGGRTLLVLDGFEVMQHQGSQGSEGDRYGLLRSSDLRRFLEYLAAPEGAAFCLITSRAPLLDLLPFTTCTQRDVTRLSPGDGRDLLRTLRVRGADEALDALVRAWDGHALTLSLLGSLLVERHGGDLTRLDDLPRPTADETRYERVHRVLRCYDEHLTPAERNLLKRFSLFRIPVKQDAFERISGASQREGEKTTRLNDQATTRLLARLLTTRLIRHNTSDDTYTTHPLIRAHYFALFTRGEPDASRDAHARIQDYYLALAGDMPHFPTLNDLQPLIEVVHHACHAGAYDEAWNIYWQRIAQRQRFVILHELGAYEADLRTIAEFFPRDPGGQPDLRADPLVSNRKIHRWILNAAGLRLMNLGRLREAISFYERANTIQLQQEDWLNASITYQNLAELHLHLGDLSAAAKTAHQALILARQAKHELSEILSLASLGWVEALLGDCQSALTHFAEAEVLERKIDSSVQHLCSLRGIWHAETLFRAASSPLTEIGERPGVRARRITEANLEIVERGRSVRDISMCHRLLGDIAVQAGCASEAHPAYHYAESLRIARSISCRPALIEALLARGRYLAAVAPAAAFAEGVEQLNEALGYALQGGYRIYEAQIRIALARGYAAQGNTARAREQVQRARALSEEMGYAWGIEDAASVLEGC